MGREDIFSLSAYNSTVRQFIESEKKTVYNIWLMETGHLFLIFA